MVFNPPWFGPSLSFTVLSLTNPQERVTQLCWIFYHLWNQPSIQYLCEFPFPLMLSNGTDSITQLERHLPSAALPDTCLSPSAALLCFLVLFLHCTTTACHGTPHHNYWLCRAPSWAESCWRGTFQTLGTLPSFLAPHQESIDALLLFYGYLSPILVH